MSVNKMEAVQISPLKGDQNSAQGFSQVLALGFRQLKAMCPEGAPESGAPYLIEIIRAPLFILAPLLRAYFCVAGTQG
jgi:hypothetical protein